MSSAFEFLNRLAFLSATADQILREIPSAPGVFALRGEAANSEPYLTRTADLRRRLRRLLAPPEALNEDGTPVLSRRLNLREKVRFIEWTRTGSDFESTLILYCATRDAFGPEQARKRLRLHAPYFLRITTQHEHPRVYSTNKLSLRSLPETFGPFPSRAAAERYCDAVLDLFKLRRCYEDLQVHPDHPGCAYGEMNKCLAPCKQACTPAVYATEAARVHAFFTTRGESLLLEVAQQREAASEAMDFEQAAALHKQWERVKAAATLADELVRPVASLRAVILQEASPPPSPDPIAPGPDSATWVSSPASHANLEEAAVFLLAHGRIVGPERLSTLGVRAVREQTAVGSSLFAQPLMLAAVPLAEPGIPQSHPHEASSLAQRETDGNTAGNPPASQPGPPGDSAPLSSPANETGFILGPPSAVAPVTLNPEDRARTVLAQLSIRAEASAAPDIYELCDYLALFRRWYYRPEKQRAGEVFLPNPDGSWPVRRILNGAARVVLGPPPEVSPVDREAAKALKTKVIHPGREGVERVVPALPKRTRSRKAMIPTDVMEN